MYKTLNFLIASLIVFLPFAGLAAKEEAPMTVEGTTTINAQQAKSLFDEGVLFVDPRRDSDWAAGRIPDAEHLELNTNFNEAALLDTAEGDKTAKIVFYCNGPKCSRSAKCATQAVNWGFTNIFYFRDGLPKWKAAGYPVE